MPPGVFELYPTIKWFHDNLNSKYLDITDKYSDVIMAHFYGHEHTDSLRSFDGPGLYLPTLCSQTIKLSYICSILIGL